jgi:hypothetical protein
MAQVLTREDGIANFVTPTGRSLGVIKETYNPALLKIAYLDNKPGDLPDDLKGHYTKVQLAEADLRKYVATFWDMSDDVAATNARKRS